MKKKIPKVNVMGERAILIEFEQEINENLLEIILFYKKVLQEELVKEKGEVINAYNSLLIYYELPIEDIYTEVSSLKRLLQKPKTEKRNKSRLFHVPVCYDPQFGLDLKVISEEKNLSEKEIINLHSSPIYIVYFIGFLPGFLYLGGLDKRLYISRKNDPRLEVKKGAVGIGGKQTGIYPKTSPGGWQIIGNSPVRIFDKTEDPPCDISAGDKLKFFPISKEEFFQISEEVESGKYEIKKEIYEN